MYNHFNNLNPAPSTILHLDLNSCFATIEQQANPYLRGKPIAVAAYTTDNGCILAPSIEAKRFGVKVGMHVREENRKLLKLLSSYTDVINVKSIDEMVLDFTHSPYFPRGMLEIAREIKMRIKKEIGDWTIYPALMLGTEDKVLDRIAFGNVRELPLL